MTNLLFGLAAAEGKSEFHLHEPYVWFLKGTPLAIDNLIITQWFIMIVLIVIAFIINKAVLNGRTTRFRTSFELLVDFLENWYASFIGGRQMARKFLPLLCTLFLFILISNYFGLIPTVGYAGSFFAPTGRWGTTLGLAIVVAISVQVISIQMLGLWGWVKHLLHLGPLSILEEFVRPFSLSLRLFGNIFGEETLLAVIVMLAPMFIPIPIMGLSLMFGLIQAIVFTTLSAIYIGGVIEAAAHHGHGQHQHDTKIVHAH